MAFSLPPPNCKIFVIQLPESLLCSPRQAAAAASAKDTQLQWFLCCCWGRQHKRQILCWLSQHEAQPQGSSVPLPALRVRMSQQAEPVVPLSTHTPPALSAPCGAASHSSPLLLHSLSAACAPPPHSDLDHLFLPQTVPPFLISNRASNFGSPCQVPVQSHLVLVVTAYPLDFPLSSFFFPCTEVLLCLLSASSLPTSLNIKL